MDYLKKSFTVKSTDTNAQKNYGDNYDRIFKKKEGKEDEKETRKPSSNRSVKRK